jgi:Putative Ig domain
MARITINGISLDPEQHADALRAASLESENASQSNYLPIQTQEPMSEEQAAQLTELGVAIHEYVPEDTYVCGYAPSDLFTSEDRATFIEGTEGNLSVAATGTPRPTISEEGRLPDGVSFAGDTLSGTPTQPGAYSITFIATNGVGQAAKQPFTLTVSSRPR